MVLKNINFGAIARRIGKVQIIGASLLLILVGGISFALATPSPEKSVNQYIYALKNNDELSKQKLRCNSQRPVELSFSGIQSWQITESEKAFKDRDSKYIKVFARINYSNNQSIARTIAFEVWESDELFEYAKRFKDKIDRQLQESEELVNSVNELLDQPSLNHTARLTILNRNDYSSEKYCVLGIQEE
jgi:hypothetical protein